MSVGLEIKEKIEKSEANPICLRQRNKELSVSKSQVYVSLCFKMDTLLYISKFCWKIATCPALDLPVLRKDDGNIFEEDAFPSWSQFNGP